VVDPDVHEIGVSRRGVCGGQQLYVWVSGSVHAAIDKIAEVDKEIYVPDWQREDVNIGFDRSRRARLRKGGPRMRS
jgi:hypothetical protein